MDARAELELLWLGGDSEGCIKYQQVTVSGHKGIENNRIFAYLELNSYLCNVERGLIFTGMRWKTFLDATEKVLRSHGGKGA